MQSNPLDDVLDLEQQYYAEGHALGLADGQRAGRSEGRGFGMEKGMEKFAAMGQMYGWAAVLKAHTAEVPSATRFTKQLDRLWQLTDPEAFSTENTEDSVADIDERLREAKAKFALISKLIGDHRPVESASNTGEMEDFTGMRTRK